MEPYSVFVTSPMDVAVERDRVQRVIAKLNAERIGHRQFRLIRWEDDYYRAEETFQDQIDSPAHSHIVICIFWKRLGTELPQSYARPDGTIPTGTEYEFEEAMRAALEHTDKLPDVLVYRKTAEVTFSADTLDLERAQYERFRSFWRRWFHNEKGHFVAAFQTFEEPDDFESLLESNLRKWLADRIGTPNWTRGSPYRGLLPFDVEHAPVFFGRRRETERTRARLIASSVAGKPFLLVSGASGSGKSSLVRAGLIPRLAQVGGLSSLGAAFRYAMTSPSQLGSDWPATLATAFFSSSALADELAAGDFPDAGALAVQLANANSAAVSPLRRALERAGERIAQGEHRNEIPKVVLLLFIDQFEEIFLWGRQQAADFLSLLDAMVEAPGQPFLVVATMRSDYHHRLAEFPELMRLTGTGEIFGPDDVERVLELNLPSPADLREMIARPATAAGLSFEKQPGGGRDLIDLIEREARPEAMPAVEFLLAKLYERRVDRLLTLAAYDDLKGVAGVMAQTGEAILQDVDADARDAFPRVVRALVAKPRRDLPPAARRVRKDAFEDDPAAGRLIERLVTARLVLTDQRSYKFAHDSVFLGWDRLREQIEEEERLFEARERIEAYCREWLEGAKGRPPRHRSLLLTGFQLSEGRDLLGKWGARALADTLPELPTYIRLSSNREKRARRLTIASAWVVAAIFAGLSGLIYQQWLFAEEARKDAQAALLVSRAEADLRDKNVPSALANARQAYTLRPNQASRSVFLSSLLEVDPHLRRTLSTGDAEIADLVWKGETVIHIATASGTLWAHPIDPQSGESSATPVSIELPKFERMQDGNIAAVQRLFQLPDATLLIIWDNDSRVLVRTASKDTPYGEPPGGQDRTLHPSPHAVSFAPQSGLLATAAVDRPLQIYHCAPQGLRPQCTKTNMSGEQERAQSVAFDPAGRRLAVGHDDGSVRLIEIATGETKSISQLSGPVLSIGWRADGKALAVGSQTGEVVTIDASKPAPSEKTRLNAPDTPIVAIAWRPGGKDLAYTCARHAVCLWKSALETEPTGPPALVKRFEGHTNAVSRLAWSPSGQGLASAGTDGKLNIWALEPVSPGISALVSHSGATFRTLAVSPGGELLAAGANDGSISIWNLATREPPRLVRPKSPSEVLSLAWSTQNRLAAIHESGAISLVGSEQTAMPDELSFKASIGSRIAWVDAGETLAVPLRDDGRIALVPAATEKNKTTEFLDAVKEGEVPWGLKADPERAVLFADYTGGDMVVWDLKTRTTIGPMNDTLGTPKDEVGAGSLTISSDGKWLARSGGDRFVRVFDIASRSTAFALEIESDEPRTVAFSRTGNKLAVLGSDDRVYIWDLEIDGRPRLASFSVVSARRATGPADAEDAHAAWIDWLPGNRLAVASRTASITIISLDPKTWNDRLDRLGDVRSLEK